MGWTISGSSGRTVDTADEHEAAEALWAMTQDDDAAHATRDGDR